MRIRLTDRMPSGPAWRRVAFLHEGRDPSAGAPAALRSRLRAAVRAAEFRGKDREIAVEGGWILAGLGTAPVPAARLRTALRRALKEPLKARRPQIAVCFDRGVTEAAVRALLLPAALCDYAFDRYKSRPRKPAPDRSALAIVPPPGLSARGLAKAAADAQAIADAVAWARDVGNTPGNDLGPADLSRETKALAERTGFRFRALDKKEIEKERMGGLLGVNAGSARPPVFLVGEYAPPKAAGTAVLVGKGITFDSGGISLKPAASMGEMKYDMMGAATVFACLAAAKSLSLPVRVVALAPVTENMPGGTATRPGDILRMRNGKTVEVDNTDAEGRLVLADALSYAERFGPDVLLDYATLTGAVLIALGSECAGVMTPDDVLAGDLVASGEAVGERLWRLPLWDEYRENLKSEWADMKNTGGRNAGTINGGIFLKDFVPPGVPWAHLDVAAVAHFEKEQSGWPAGASGFGVALTIDFSAGDSEPALADRPSADAPVALVTAASRGIGAACARELARRGYRLALLARSDALSAIASELGAVAVAGSVAVEEDLSRLVDAALKRYGRIDAVVNNTGHPAKGDLLSIGDDDWKTGVDLVLLSVVRLARGVTPVFQRQGGGAIVNISSLWAVEPHLDAPVSSTLRAALSAYTKLYADRYAGERIRMNCVLAGFVSTYPVADKFASAIPMRRVGDPAEVARVAAFLLSEDAAYVTGQSIRSDGGLTRSF